jgi:hypothetical protein
MASNVREIVAELEAVCEELHRAEMLLAPESEMSRKIGDSIDRITQAIDYLQNVNPNEAVAAHSAVEVSGWLRLVIEILSHL